MPRSFPGMPEISKPSASRAQHNYIEMLRHDKKKRKGSGFSEDQLNEWHNADKKNKKWKKEEHAAKKAEPDPSVGIELQHMLARMRR